MGSLPFKVLVMGRPVSCGASCTVPVIAVLATAISGVGGLADWTRQGVHARPLQRMATRPMRTNLLIKHALGPRQGELIRCREGKDTLGQPHEGRTKQHQHMHWQAQAAPPPLFKHVSSKNMQMTITKKKKKKTSTLAHRHGGNQLLEHQQLVGGGAVGVCLQDRHHELQHPMRQAGLVRMLAHCKPGCFSDRLHLCNSNHVWKTLSLCFPDHGVCTTPATGSRMGVPVSQEPGHTPCMWGRGCRTRTQHSPRPSSAIIAQQARAHCSVLV